MLWVLLAYSHSAIRHHFLLAHINNRSRLEVTNFLGHQRISISLNRYGPAVADAPFASDKFLLGMVWPRVLGASVEAGVHGLWQMNGRLGNSEANARQTLEHTGVVLPRNRSTNIRSSRVQYKYTYCIEYSSLLQY